MQTAPLTILKEGRYRNSILKVLAYFDIFHYPLTLKEISRFLDCISSPGELEPELEELVSGGVVFCFNGYYTLQNNPLLIHKRKEGNQRAIPLIKKALGIGRILYQFPFVRAIGISGSLSKDFASEKADIDYFIITKANRLWIARTLMHIYKKCFYLVGQSHFYCMNYFIDEKALLLNDQNIFTAIELKTLIPVSGYNTLKQFTASNSWADEWIPQYEKETIKVKVENHSWVKRISEWLIDKLAGNNLDDFLFKLTTRRWKKKEQRHQRNRKGLPMKLITGKHFSKSDAGDFQEKVLRLHEEKMRRVLGSSALE